MSTTKKLWLFSGSLVAIVLITIIPIWVWFASLAQDIIEIAPQRKDILSTLRSILVALAAIPAVGLLISIVTSRLIARRVAQRLVEDAHSYAENIVDTVREPLVVLNSDLKVQSANRSFYQTFHLEPANVENKPPSHLGNDQWNTPKLRSLLKDVIRKEVVIDGFEIESDFPHIGNRTLALNARKLRQENSDSALILLAIEDITEKKRIEKERKKAEAAEIQYKILFENLPGMFLVLDPEYTIKTASNAYLRATMTERGQIVNRNIFDVFPDNPDEPGADGVLNLKTSLDRVRKTKKTDVMAVQRYPARKPDGSFEERFWSPINSPVIGPDDKLFFIIHRVEDVTEYVRITEQGNIPGISTRTQMLAAEIVQRGHELQEMTRQLQEKEHRFRTLVEQVRDYAIFMTDENGLATTWNEGVYRVLGFTEKEFIGVDIVDSIFLPEDVANGVAQSELNEAATTGSASEDRWMTRKDGTHFWAAGVTTGLHDEKGNLIGFMKVMRDQTERKRLEEDLRSSANELAESDRRKTEFLATLGHELRNPLAPISTGLEAMKLLKDDPAALMKIHSTMEQQLCQLVRLIDDLLDISRITHGKMELRKCRVALSDVVRSTVEASKPFVDKANHKLLVSIPNEAIILDADPHRLAQVFSNLLNNAIKYTPEGGTIRLMVEKDKHGVRICVQDNGLGIAEEKVDTIFDAFTQIDQPLEQGYSGLGIGLTLVKRLVELHDGSIEVYSDGLRTGSTFTVRLPTLNEPAQLQPAEKRPSSKAGPLRILVVDDNKEAATMLKQVLEILGNEVRTAYNGQQAVNVASEYLPDVVLMDIGMPQMNGYEAARHIRNQSYGANIVLIALTGWGQDEDKLRTQSAGFDYHLVKPTNLAELQKLLANCQPTTREHQDTFS